MAYGLIWSPSARLDLRGILSYIEEFDPDAAAKFGKGVFDAVENLTLFPESGRVVPEFRNLEIREIIRKPCRIIYRVKHEAAEVQIVRIWHAARGKPDI